MAGIDREELRQLVRQALQETLGRGGAHEPNVLDAMRAALSQPKPATITVAVGSAADLDRFAHAVLGAADDPGLKAAILAGEIRFVPSERSSTAPQQPNGATASFDKGVLSEAKVVELSRKGRSIVIGKSAVVTPLAREKARQLKIELVRKP
jgi:hypothetical protein